MPLFGMFSKREKSIEQLIRESMFDQALSLLEGQYKEAWAAADHNRIPALLRQQIQCRIGLGQTEKAVSVLCELGDYYSERGFFPKSVATFQKALKSARIMSI